MNYSSLQALSLIDLHKHLNSSKTPVFAIRNDRVVGRGGGTGETLSVADGVEQQSATLIAMEYHGNVSSSLTAMECHGSVYSAKSKRV